MYDFYFWYWLIGNLSIFFGWIFVLLIISFAIFVMMFFAQCEGNSKNNYIFDSEKFRKKINSLMKKTLVPITIFFLLIIFFPTKKEYIMFYSAKTLDIYNAEQPKSNLTPEQMLNLIDKSVEKIRILLDGINKEK